jgi:hypothetical protein
MLVGLTVIPAVSSLVFVTETSPRPGCRSIRWSHASETAAHAAVTQVAAPVTIKVWASSWRA